MIKTLQILLIIILIIPLLGFPIPTFAVNTHAMDLESTNFEEATITDASQTGLDLTTDFTFELWVKPESLVTNSFIGKFTTAGNQRQYWFVMYDAGAGSEHIQLNVSEGGNDVNCGLDWASGTDYTAIGTGSWVHMAVVFDADNGTNCAAELFRNGVSQSTKTGIKITDIHNGTGDFSIGGRPAVDHFDGIIDDVRVWNDMRTATEIANNYQKELVGNEQGLVGYWKLNNDLTDATSNGNNLTDVNTITFVTDVPFSGAAEAPNETTIIIISFKHEDFYEII